MKIVMKKCLRRSRQDFLGNRVNCHSAGESSL